MRTRRENRVSVNVTLDNGECRAYAWATPVTFGRCLSKGARWAREALAAEQVKGRSAIVAITVTVRRTGKAWRRR